MPDLTEQQIAELIALLPPAPEGWIAAAQQLPSARQAIDTLAARAEASAQARAAILQDLETALQNEGIDARPDLVDELRTRLR